MLDEKESMMFLAIAAFILLVLLLPELQAKGVISADMLSVVHAKRITTIVTSLFMSLGGAAVLAKVISVVSNKNNMRR
jgi:hypothetical protein